MKKNIALFILLVSSPAYAHMLGVEHGTFANGFIHPFSGLDHMLTMFFIGFIAERFLNKKPFFLMATLLLATCIHGHMHSHYLSLPYFLGFALGTSCLQALGIAFGMLNPMRTALEAR